jgi:gluconokinase
MDHIIAIDIGTGSVRALVVDENLNIHTVISVPLTLASPHPGWSVQDPEEVVEAVFSALKKAAEQGGLNKERVAALCFSAAVSSLLLLDEHGDPISLAAIWADRRSNQQAVRLAASDGSDILKRTGCPVHATYLPAKLRWWRDERPADLEKAARILSLKEFVLQRLCGEFVIDHSMACATGLVNISSLDWDECVTTLSGIRAEQLSEIVPTSAVRPMIPSISRSLGLREDLPIVIGASDGVLSNLGAGGVRAGQLVTMVGSSGAARMGTNRPWFDPEGRTWCYPIIVGERWIAGGANNAGGLVLDWVAAELLGLPDGTDAAELLKRANQVPAGASGLVFLPTILGERSPIWDESARGVLFGLSDRHGGDHILRATCEGILYSLHSIYRVLEEGLGSAAEIRATGGYTRSVEWLQMQASLFGAPVSIPEQSEGSALGAAILGWVALGRFRDLDEGAELIRIYQVFPPDESAIEVYERGRRVHEALYERLADLFVSGQAE